MGVALLSALLATTLLSACGQKGPLVPYDPSATPRPKPAKAQP